MTLTLVAFCPNRTEGAGRPGQPPNNAIQLQAVRAGNLSDPKEKDPNEAHFTDGSGSAHITLNGLTDKVWSQFRGGRKYKITIEEAE
jgi:hypothetical protein